MKRVSLILDKVLLQEATRALGARSYSAAVTAALTEVLRVRKVQGLASFFGRNLWQGDLAQMRGVTTQSAIRKRRNSIRHRT